MDPERPDHQWNFADLYHYRLHDDGSEPTRASAFSSPQSLVAFPLATSVVATVTRAARTIAAVDGESVVVPLTAAFIVGFLLAAISVADPRSRPRTGLAWVTAVCVAVVNSLLVFVAARGIDKF